MATRYSDMASLEKGLNGWWGHSRWVVEVEASAEIVERFLNDLDDLAVKHAARDPERVMANWAYVAPVSDKKGNLLYCFALPKRER